MNTKIKGTISILLIISMILPFALQTAAYEIFIEDDICGEIAESSVMAKCYPGNYITNYNVRIRYAPSLEGKKLSYIRKGKIFNVESVTLDSDGYYWGYTKYSTATGIFSGYVRLDNCTKYTVPKLTTVDINGKNSVNWTVVDISSYQREDCIDWNALKKAGVKGVILRIGGRGYGSTGTLYTDDAFLCHYLNARAAGLHIGCYFFSYALTAAKAKEEADYVLDLMEKYDAEFDMPIFIDIEDAGGDTEYKHQKIAGKTGCTKVCKAFCEEIEKAGYFAGIYCNLYFGKYFVDPSAFIGRAAWIAQYNTSCDYTGTTVDIWQYTSTGNIDGFFVADENGDFKTEKDTGELILGNLDVNHCYKNFPKIIANLNKTQESTTVETKTEETTTIKAPEIQLITEKTDETTTARETTTKEQTTEIQTDSKTVRTENTVIIRTATCTSNGLSKYYLNNVNVGWEVTEKSHAACVECILQNKTSVSVGVKLTEDDIKSAMHSDSSYFATALAAIKKKNSFTVSYCPDCLKVISINYYYASTVCQHKNTVSTVITEATCLKDGIQQTKCAGCSEILSESIIPKGHSTETVLTTDTTTPYTVKKCTVCSKSIAKRILEKGDIDYNGKVSIKDARTVLRMAIGLTDLNEIAVKLGDSDGDNILTVTDARNALRKATKLE